MSARCRGCGGAVSPIWENADGLCSGGNLPTCYASAVDWAARHGFRCTTMFDSYSLPPVTVDAWLEAGAPGKREP